MKNLRKLSIKEVKSWLNQAEFLENLSIDEEKIQEFADLFYPGAEYVSFRLGGEYNDSGYDLSVGEIKAGGFDNNGGKFDFERFDDSNEFEKFTKINYGDLVVVELIKSLESQGYTKLAREVQNSIWKWQPIDYYAVTDIFYNLKRDIVDTSKEVDSFFCSDWITYDLKRKTMIGLVEVPDIYGNESDFPDGAD